MPLIPYTPACAPYGTGVYNSYGYQPSLVVGVIFSILFGLMFLTQIFYIFRTRAYWNVFFAIGAGLETLGWIGRTVAHVCSYSDVINTMQIATLIMGPAWTQIGIYLTSYILIARVFGTKVSPIPPAIYLSIIFVVDTVTLALQATGGGLAGSESDAGEYPTVGTNIMLAGIVAQLASGCGFAVFIGIVFPRAWTQIKENRSLKIVCGAIIITQFMMILRGFYRSVELGQGWTGYLIRHEVYIVCLDALPMLLAMGTLAIINPSVFLLKAGLTREDIMVAGPVVMLFRACRGSRKQEVTEPKNLSDSSDEEKPVATKDAADQV